MRIRANPALFDSFFCKCRDVIPPTGSCETSQRGGCMVILNKNEKSLNPLAVHQHGNYDMQLLMLSVSIFYLIMCSAILNNIAPTIKLHDGQTTHSRRSVSLLDILFDIINLVYSYLLALFHFL